MANKEVKKEDKKIKQESKKETKKVKKVEEEKEIKQEPKKEIEKIIDYLKTHFQMVVICSMFIIILVLIINGNDKSVKLTKSNFDKYLMINFDKKCETQRISSTFSLTLCELNLWTKGKSDNYNYEDVKVTIRFKGEGFDCTLSPHNVDITGYSATKGCQIDQKISKDSLTWEIVDIKGKLTTP